MSTVIDPAVVRLGVAQILEEARATAWKALREQGEGASIPVARFAHFVDKIGDIDRALAFLELQAGSMGSAG
jgi:hypothetical protein